MKLIFDRKSAKAYEELIELRNEKHWEKEYEHDLMLAFWLAIHREDLYLIEKLINWDIQLRYLVTLAVKRRKENPSTIRKKKKEGMFKKKRDLSENQLELDLEGGS